MKFWKKALIAGATGLAVTTLWTGTAQAADHDERCSVGIGGSMCLTGEVPANSANQITFWVEGGVFCAQADFYIYDTVNGNTIYSRHVGSGTVGETLNNVYSTYRLQIYNSCAGGRADLWS